MDGDKKKRKMKDAADEENEEEKMEEIFALIKSTREVRERMAAAQNREKPTGEKPPAAVWNPTFRPEDFMEAARPAPEPPQAEERRAEAGPSTEGPKQGSDEKSEDKDLDLNLSL